MNHFEQNEVKYLFGKIFKLEYLSNFEVGDAFGLLGMKEDLYYQRGVFANSECYVLSIHREEFRAIFDEEKNQIKNKIETFRNKF